MIHFESKDSSSIHSASYEPKSHHLQISFRGSTGHKSTTHSYFGMLPAQWEAFAAAPSKGKHFASHIRGRFTEKAK